MCLWCRAAQCCTVQSLLWRGLRRLGAVVLTYLLTYFDSILYWYSYRLQPSFLVLFFVTFTPFFTAVVPCALTRYGAARGHEGSPQLVPAGAGAVNCSRTLPKARVTARVRLHMRLERVSRRNKSTARVGSCKMSGSFGTLALIGTLPQVYI